MTYNQIILSDGHVWMEAFQAASCRTGYDSMLSSCLEFADRALEEYQKRFDQYGDKR
jgi:hypothetical protein